MTPPGDSHLVVRVVTSTTRGGSPLHVRFDASASRAATGAPLGFQWDFGDGSTAHGAIVEHTYTTRGTFRARVTADAGTQSARSDVWIEVEGHGDLDAPSIALPWHVPRRAAAPAPVEVSLAMR